MEKFTENIKEKINSLFNAYQNDPTIKQKCDWLKIKYENTLNFFLHSNNEDLHNIRTY